MERGNPRSLFLANGRLVYPSHIKEKAHILVENGRIVEVGPDVSAPKGVEIIDLDGLMVFPGLIDPHVHLRDFEHSHRGDIESETAAAAVGGFTTVLDMPNSDPPTVSASSYEERCARADKTSYVNYGLYGWAGPETIDSMPQMHEAGVIGFKLFMAESNLSTSYITRDLPNLARILEVAAELDAIVAPHAESDGLIKFYEGRVRKSLPPDLNSYLASRPPLVEEIAVFEALSLARWVGARIHICHVSTGDTVDVIENAKKKYPKISCEVPQSNLCLTVEETIDFAGLAKFSPPVRTRADQKRLWDGLRSGTIDMIATDHAPQTLGDKISSNNIWEVRAGSPLLEIGFCLMLDAAHKEFLSYTDIASLMAERPARIFRLYPQKGTLLPNSDADIVVVDPDCSFSIDSKTFKSKGASIFTKWK